MIRRPCAGPHELAATGRARTHQATFPEPSTPSMYMFSCTTCRPDTSVCTVGGRAHHVEVVEVQPGRAHVLRGRLNVRQEDGVHVGRGHGQGLHIQDWQPQWTVQHPGPTKIQDYQYSVPNLVQQDVASAYLELVAGDVCACVPLPRKLGPEHVLGHHQVLALHNA